MKYLSIFYFTMILLILAIISCSIADRYIGVNQRLLSNEKDSNNAESSSSSSVPFSPSDINNLELWLDANDSSTITATGVDVDQWADKSGNSNNFVQLTANYRPNINSTGLNGNTTIAFTSANPNYNKLSGVGTIDCILSTIFIVYKPITDTSFYFLGYSTSYRISVSAISTFNLAYSGTTVESITHTNIADNNAHILMVKIRGNGFKFVSSLDGDIESNSVNDVVKTDYLINTIGAVNNASTAVADLFNGDIAEIVIYNVILSNDDKQKIEGYLAHKWGLTGNLPSDHPYKTAAP